MAKFKVNFKNPKNNKWLKIEIEDWASKLEIIEYIFEEINSKEDPRKYTISIAEYGDNMKDLSFKDGVSLVITKKKDSIAPCMVICENDTLKAMLEKAKNKCGSNFTSCKV